MAIKSKGHYGASTAITYWQFNLNAALNFHTCHMTGSETADIAVISANSAMFILFGGTIPRFILLLNLRVSCFCLFRPSFDFDGFHIWRIRQYQVKSSTPWTHNAGEIQNHCSSARQTSICVHLTKKPQVRKCNSFTTPVQILKQNISGMSGLRVSSRNLISVQFRA